MKSKFYFSVPNLEEEVAKLPDKDGWIRINEFMKFAMPLDLCKIEFHDRVFQKVDYEAEEEKRKKEAKKESKVKVKIFSKLFWFFPWAKYLSKSFSKH